MDRDEETARIQCKLFIFFIILEIKFLCSIVHLTIFIVGVKNNLRIDYEGLVLILVSSLIFTRVFIM